MLGAKNTPNVVERTREVGIRIALGTPKGVVLRGVLLEGATTTLIGMIGGACALRHRSPLGDY